MNELHDIPTDQLADAIDMAIWDMTSPDRERIAAWHAELRARPDRDTPAVRLAADVCMEYLAQSGSPFEQIIGERVKKEFGLTPDQQHPE